eukprot:g1911.t1
MSNIPNPWVWFKIEIDGKYVGKVVFELRQDIAPKCAENFRSLCTGWKGPGKRAEKLHFKGSKMTKIIPGCVIQGGDIIRNKGTEGESIYAGENFEDENFLLRHVGPGILSSCNSGPNSNNSRFFITLAKLPWMDDRHVVFGYVISGMDVIRTIEAAGSLEHGLPTKEVIIQDCGECTPKVV